MTTENKTNEAGNHTRIPNDIADTLLKLKASGSIHRIIQAVLRKIYGWHDKYVYAKWIVENTGLSKQKVSDRLKELIEMQIINRDEKKRIYINENVDEWLVTENGNYTKKQLPKTGTQVTENGYSELPKTGTQCDDKKLDNNELQDPKETIIKKLKKETIKTFRFSDDDFKMASLLSELKTRNKPNRKPTTNKDLENWADISRLMRERDNRTIEQIEKVLRFSQDHNFWHTVVLSMDKLRIQFDKLEMQMDGKQKNKQRYVNEAAKYDDGQGHPKADYDFYADTPDT